MLVTTFDTYKTQFLPEKINTAIAEVVALLRENPLPENGNYPLSNDAFAIVMRYNTKEAHELRYETHDVMTDIQIVLEGEEYFYARQAEDMTKTESGDDIQFYAEQSKEYSRAYLSSGSLAVIYPLEAHAPAMCVENPSAVVKLVVKIPL